MFETFKANRRLKDLDERLEKLERSFKQMQMEWEDTYDRLRRVVQRVAKRAELVEKAEKEQSETVAEDTLPTPPGLDPISAKILARRNRISGRPQ